MQHIVFDSRWNFLFFKRRFYNFSFFYLMGSLSHWMTPAKKWVWVLSMDLIAIPRHKRQVIKSSLSQSPTWLEKKIKVKSDLIYLKKKSSLTWDLKKILKIKFDLTLIFYLFFKSSQTWLGLWLDFYWKSRKEI